MRRASVGCFLFFSSVFHLTCRSGEVTRWVEQLAAESFAEREAASLALWNLGDAAMDDLRRAAKSADPEVRLRAEQLVQHIEWGVRPSWPGKFRETVAVYRSLSTEQRHKFLRELSTVLKGESLPFLLWRLREGESDASTSAAILSEMLDVEEQRQWILDRVKEPASESEAHLLSRVLLLKEIGLEAFPVVLSSAHLAVRDRNALIHNAIEKLRALLDQKHYEELEKTAGQLMDVAPSEARFVYLRAAGLAFLQRDEEAAALCAKAFSLNPDNKVAHYQSADLLRDLHQHRLALMEWRRVLEIPPHGEVYDLNAHMGLGTAHLALNEHAEAADAFEAGLKGYRNAKAGGGSGMAMTISEDELEARITRLRKQAEAGKEGLVMKLDIVIRDDQKEELEKMKAKADATLSMNIQPHGLRLFEVAPATVVYDATQKKVLILLNGSPVNDGIPAEFTSKTPVVGVHTLDRWYFFALNLQEGSSEKIAAIDMDYVLRISPNTRLAAWESPGLTLNGTSHSWAELAEGLPFDHLPEAFKMEIQGITPEGRETRIQFEADPAKLIR